MSKFVFACVSLTLLCLPSLALACSVCGFGEDDTQQAFLVTTGIMTGIPLLALGGVLFFISRRSSSDDQND